MTNSNNRIAPTSEHLPLLIGLRELVRLLARSRASIARDVTAGRIPPPVRIGRSTKWRRAEIADWVATGCPSRQPRPV